MIEPIEPAGRRRPAVPPVEPSILAPEVRERERRRRERERQRGKAAPSAHRPDGPEGHSAPRPDDPARPRAAARLDVRA